MKRYEVRFQPQARSDLLALYDYIADAAGTGVAETYIGRIETACLSLETFPERGARRDDIRPGLRTMGFERRATIAFIVESQHVVIVRIFMAGGILNAPSETRSRPDTGAKRVMPRPC